MKLIEYRNLKLISKALVIFKISDICDLLMVSLPLPQLTSEPVKAR